MRGTGRTHWPGVYPAQEAGAVGFAAQSDSALDTGLDPVFAYQLSGGKLALEGSFSMSLAGGGAPTVLPRSPAGGFIWGMSQCFLHLLAC